MMNGMAGFGASVILVQDSMQDPVSRCSNILQVDGYDKIKVEPLGWL